MALEFNEQELRKAVAILKPEKRLFEIRLIKDKWNAAGYFTDVDTLVDALKAFPAKPGANAYIVLNRIHEACYSREAHDRFVEYMKPTVSDNDIKGYDWLMVDIDPKRPAGTSSTDAQVKGSQVVAGKIYSYLKEHGWEEPVVAMSGNGTHLLYAVKMDSTPERQKLAQNCLMALNMMFSDDDMDIDLKTFNPARICKLYGTVARKGSNTADRPHRMSKILRAPDEVKVTPVAFLEKLAGTLPQEEQPQKYNKYNPKGFDVDDWIAKHGVVVTEKTSWQGGTKWILDHCPFNEQHNNKDASIIQKADGKICFNCFHNSCADKKWKDFRKFYEPDYQEKKDKAIPNYIAMFPVKGAGQKPEEEQTDLGPVFLTTEYIRNMPQKNESFIKTGIKDIDLKMRGLKRGFVTVLSGLRSAGKSSILSQLVIESRHQGLKTALYSGEMTPKQVMRWLTLQAAGKDNVVSTDYENVFNPKPKAAEMISQWLDNFVFIYNNDYGNNFQELLNHLETVVEKEKLDLVLIDNLMALDIKDLDDNVYMQQRAFVLALKRMAERLDIHVLFVAHPRKADGYLRMNDISGSGDLTNAVDNVFIIHRVDDDYKSLTQQFYHWRSDNPMYQATNVIEICKDRDTGYRDEHIPLWFEKETKRLKSEESQFFRYAWDTTPIPEGFTPVDEEVPW